LDGRGVGSWHAESRLVFVFVNRSPREDKMVASQVEKSALDGRRTGLWEITMPGVVSFLDGPLEHSDGRDQYVGSRQITGAFMEWIIAFN
jgi:hypothetical protein